MGHMLMYPLREFPTLTVTIQHALEFIRSNRGRVSSEDSLAKICALASDQGLQLTPADLRAAHLRDWQLRWQRFSVITANRQES